MSEPFCPEFRELVVKNSKKQGEKVRDRTIIACTKCARLETPAEIEMFRRVVCDVVVMTVVPETVLARELDMCYATMRVHATVCFVSNMVAGIQQRLTVQDVTAGARENAYYSANLKRDNPLFTAETSMSMCHCTAGRKIRG
jgi:5'-methylthioadenosine phosphorylase